MFRIIATGLLLGVASGAVDSHPRLLMTEAEEQQVRKRLVDDDLSRQLNDRIIELARGMLKERTCRYDIPDGKRLLRESRHALEIVMHCAWAWRMTEEEVFRERVVKELDAASALKDWNPSHFLDTAEMATAVAIGYDWLFEELDDEQRERYEEALRSKALLPAKKVYDSKGWWSNVSNNWSQVCATGISMGAAAVEEKDPPLSTYLMEKGKALLDGCKVFYQPEGGYPEGPAYWHYGTNYQVLGYALFEGLGQPMDIPPVMEQSGDFMIQMVGPLRLPFNFADANANRDSSTPAQSWIARHFENAGQSRRVRQVVADELLAKKGKGGRFMPLHVLWLPPEPVKEASLPLSAVFQGEQSVAAFRTRWDPDASYFAIKGGSALASHGHMDVGSFIYDAGGVRWIHDMGSDNYNLPSYFGKKRWSYFRLNSLSHNVLTIAGELQRPIAEPVALSGDRRKHEINIDLTPVYRGQAASVKRRSRFDSTNGEVRIIDEVEKPEGDVRWAIFTRADARLAEEGVWLEQDGKKLLLTRHDGGAGDWEIDDALPPTKEENQNKGYRRVSFTAAKAPVLKLEVSWRLVTP